MMKRKNPRWNTWMENQKPAKSKPKIKAPTNRYSDVPDNLKDQVVGNYKSDENNVDAFEGLDTEGYEPALSGTVLMGSKFPLQIRHFPRKAPLGLIGRVYSSGR